MVFMAQINFENSNSGNQSLSPKTGILMLFVSVDYSNFRAKDQSWFKVVYEANPESGASRDERPQVDKDFLPVARLVPEVIEHLRWDGADLLMEKFPLLNSLSAGERDKILTWWQKASKRSEARFDDVHQICCSDDEQAREACVRATFYANGISFDQARKVDGHYKHLVDYAAEWEVLWKLAGLNRFLPNEKRQLYICIHRRNLAEFDFSKCAAVFL